MITGKEIKTMARAKKEYRELTVSEATNYGRKTAPMLRIQGHWFQELGFNVGWNGEIGIFIQTDRPYTDAD